jgi:methylenetetrahydrofolate--tRNA-(uracil-5-)-methyltransferase
MNANFGIMPELPELIRDKREKARRKAENALAAVDRFAAALDEGHIAARDRARSSADFLAAL